MQPFDDITSPELGLEDDVLAAPTAAWQDGHSGLGQPTPKWMRSPSSTPVSLFTSFAHRIGKSAVPWTSRGSAALLPFLRPRLTIRYIIFSALALYATYRILTSRPLLASNLPPYSTGPYDVGAVDIELPLDLPKRINHVTFKVTGKPAFEVDTVLFTLYYPTQKGSTASRRDKLYWIPKPISATAEGYARALGVNNWIVRPILTFALWLIAGSITIPAHVGAPLLPPDAAVSSPLLSEDKTLPVVVFTHGMLSSRTDYTAYLGALASNGVVVAALEHRDGSSPGSYLSLPTSQPQTTTWRYYFGLKDLDLTTTHTDFDTPALKRAQLDFRTAEIDAAVAVLQSLNSAKQLPRNPRAPASFDASLFAARLDTARMTLAGHSYGATGVLHALRPGTASATPFAGAVVLDPGKSSGQLNADIAVPLVVCHSASWSRTVSVFFGRPHFEVVRGLVEGVNERCNSDPTENEKDRKDGECQPRAKGWFLTSLGTSHPSITDAPLLEPLLLSWTTGSTMDAAEGVAQYVNVTADFVRYQHGGAPEGVLALKGEGVVSREYDPKNNNGMPERWRRYWQLHVAPE